MAASAITGCFRFCRLVSDSSLNFRQVINSCRVISPQLQQSLWLWSSARTSGDVEAKTKESVTDKSNVGKEGISEAEQKLQSSINELNKDIETLTQKVVTLEDKYKRSLADGENLRLRLTKQIEDAKLFGIQGFCKDLLEVSDILQRATESVPKDEISPKNPHLKSLYEGLTMTEAQLQSVFKRHGLVPVNPIDEKFNPNLHEALFQQEVEGKEPGTVVVVSKIGYKLHERVIRPALVGVVKAP